MSHQIWEMSLNLQGMVLVPRSHHVELKKSYECKKTYYGMLMNLGHISLGSNPCYGKQSIKHPKN